MGKWMLLIFAFLWTAVLPVEAASPLALFVSSRNSAAYEEQHLGEWEDAWLSFKQTIESANLRYDIVNENDIGAARMKLSGYRAIIIPFLIDLTPSAAAALKSYTAAGGKLLLTDGGGMPGRQGQEILQLAGVKVSKHTSMTAKESLIWPLPFPVKRDFAIATLYANIMPQEGSDCLSRWQDEAGQTSDAAIIKKNNSIYFGWAPGLQGEISTNAELLSFALEDLCPGVTQQAAVQISFAEYQQIQQDLGILTRQTDEAIKTARQADLAVSFKSIQQKYDSGVNHVKAFNEAYHARQFYQAAEELKQARADFATAFAQAMPVRPVEGRCIWLDRGTIVACKNPQGLAELFDRLKKAGVNTVYFETNNAGFSMYPSKLTLQNPDMRGWDPLGIAIKEAHKRDMELHAWVWIFNVGNTKHNPIVGREPDYPGPVLSTHDFTWALTAANGSLLPPHQSEFWLDPANPEARQFAKDLILEIACNYPVDGIQYDYIRYPFNGRGGEMGYDWAGRTAFEKETGLSLDKLDDATRQVWQAWKVQLINDFVRDISTTLKRMKPGFRISAAVYALPVRWRLSAIQQEWETWVANGWVDTINPMTYVTTPGDLQIKAGSVRDASQDKSLVFPGLKLLSLDTAGMVEQLDASRAIGTLGTTMFACAHLDDNKMNMLKLGPYRRQALMTPQSNPMHAGRILIDDFAAMVNRYLQSPQKHILSDQASTNDVLSQIMTIQHHLHRLRDNASASDIAAVERQVALLHMTIKDWLRLEAFIERGFRAQYIVNYLGQLEAILSYASQKARFEEHVSGAAVKASEPAPTSLGHI